jgi:hypothetical protein
MTRRHLVLLFALASCQTGDQGAVSMRWRVVVQETGAGYDPRDTGQPGGACQLTSDHAVPGTGNNCRETVQWTVHRIRLQVNDPVTGLSRNVPNSITEFDCRAREATTSFDIPLGVHALSLCAFNPATPDRCDEGDTPPPAVREVKKAEIANLDVVEISVHEQPIGRMGECPTDGGTANPQ